MKLCFILDNCFNTHNVISGFRWRRNVSNLERIRYLFVLVYLLFLRIYRLVTKLYLNENIFFANILTMINQDLILIMCELSFPILVGIPKLESLHYYVSNGDQL